MKTIRKGSRHFDKAQHDFESLIQTAREVTPIDKLRSSQILAEAVYDDLKDFFFQYQRNLGCKPEAGSREEATLRQCRSAIETAGDTVESLGKAISPFMISEKEKSK